MQEFSEEKVVMQKVSLFETGECDDWCFGIAGIGFLILFGVCLCLLRAGSEADDRMRELFEERKDR